MDSASELTSVEVNSTFQEVAREAFSADQRLALIAEDALAFLKRQPAASYDLVFADALAGKYDGLDDALRVVKAGGFYIIDDMLPQPNWPDGHAPKVSALIANLAAHPGFQMIPLAWASGIVVAVRKRS
jgi:predicted O-methyltransferase YrrM